MRIAVLTTRSRRGLAILQALVARDIEIHAVVIDRGALSARDKLRKTVRTVRRRGVSEATWRVKERFRRTLKKSRVSNGAPGYELYSETVCHVADPNSDAGVDVITGLAPDLLVLGSVRLLTPRVIAIPRYGVFNAHPGWLPDYRGNDVIPWAVYHGGPVGVTVHVVDPGIDTGPIVARRELEVVPGDTLESLTGRAATAAADLMADTVERLLSTGRLESVPQDVGRGGTFTRMPADLRQRVEERLAAQQQHA